MVGSEEQLNLVLLEGFSNPSGFVNLILCPPWITLLQWVIQIFFSCRTLGFLQPLASALLHHELHSIWGLHSWCTPQLPYKRLKRRFLSPWAGRTGALRELGSCTPAWSTADLSECAAVPQFPPVWRGDSCSQLFCRRHCRLVGGGLPGGINPESASVCQGTRTKHTPSAKCIRVCMRWIQAQPKIQPVPWQVFARVHLQKNPTQGLRPKAVSLQTCGQ